MSTLAAGEAYFYGSCQLDYDSSFRHVVELQVSTHFR